MSRRFVNISLFKRLLAVLRDLPPSDEVSALIAECEKAIGKGRVKRKAVSCEQRKRDGVVRDDPCM